MTPEEFLGLGICKELVIIIVSALPISELRGAIPVGINVFDMPWYTTLPLALLGNMLPVPLILLFLNAVTRLLNRINIFQRFFTWLFDSAQRKGQLIRKYRRLGLILLVAIPLPMTGAWTGSIAAVLFGVPFGQAMLAIFTGVVIAGIIVTCLSVLGWTGAIIAGIVLAGIVIFRYIRRSKQASEIE